VNHVLRSEWTKLRGLRSTWLTLLATAVIGVGIGALIAQANGLGYFDSTPEDQAVFDPTAVSLTSIILAQLVIGTLGVLAMSSEYATGSIQVSLTAVPRRGRLYAAKIVVFGALALVTGQVIGFSSFFLGQSLIAGTGAPTATIGQPGVLRAVIGCGLYLAMLGLLGLALGAIVRSTAGALGALVTITLLVRFVGTTLPAGLQEWVGKYWPITAGEKITAVVVAPDALPPWTGFGVLCGFTAALLLGGYTLLRSRDA
jgi:ABC-type transport system involved in multi-copper enzyme maturation permease subunit